LYHPTILNLNKHPYNYRKLEDADNIVKAYNPLCGDQFTVYLKMEGERIAEATFHGYGCAVSKASTSLLVKYLEGHTLQDFQYILEELNAVVGEADASHIEHQDLLAFQQVRQFSGRIPCVRLAWDALGEFIGL